MAVYPKPSSAYDTSMAIPITPYSWREVFQTVSGAPGGPFAGGKATTRFTRPFGLYAVTLRYSKNTRAKLKDVIQFHRQMKGKATKFTFVDFHGWNVPDPNGVWWDDLFCCVATAGQTVVELPIISDGAGHDLQMQVNGVDAGATFSWGGAFEGRDEATMDDPLVKGDIVTVSGTGRRTHYMRFVSDTIELQTDANNLCSTGDIALLEDRGEEA